MASHRFVAFNSGKICSRPKMSAKSIVNVRMWRKLATIQERISNIL
jgi:hypothetical protein